MRGSFGFGALVIALAAPVMAHTPYVLPSVFDAGTRDQVTIEASFSEEAFRPEVAMRDAPFEITGPDGRTVKLTGATQTRDRTMIEAALPADGLYRISSGQRLGRMNKMFRRGGEWVLVGDGETAPTGTALTDVRSTTLADVYVLRGKPGGDGALEPRGTALEIQPRADPSGFAPGAPTAFTILYDGKPLAGALVTLSREAGYYDGRKQVAEVKTDAKGSVTVTPADAGRYLMMVRHRPQAAPAGGVHLSYTATLAFEVL